MPLGNVGLNATVTASVNASNFSNATGVADDVNTNGFAALLLNASTVNLFTGFSSARPVGVIRHYSASCYIIYPISNGLHAIPFMRFDVDTGDNTAPDVNVIAKVDNIQTEGLNYVVFQSLVTNWPIQSAANTVGHPNGYTLGLSWPLKVYAPATASMTVEVGFLVTTHYTTV